MDNERHEHVMLRVAELIYRIGRYITVPIVPLLALVTSSLTAYYAVTHAHIEDLLTGLWAVLVALALIAFVIGLGAYTFFKRHLTHAIKKRGEPLESIRGWTPS